MMILKAALCVLLASKFDDIFASVGERKLSHDLFVTREYNRLIRPVENTTQSVNVSFNMELFQLIRIDVKFQLMKVSVWLTKEWNDLNLRWNPKEYDGINELYTRPHRLWLPDLVLYNDAKGIHLDQSTARIKIHHTGLITWKMPAILKSTCKLNMKFFPFDTQDCVMKFGSNANDITRLDLQLKSKHVLLDNYLKNNEWRLLSTLAVRNEQGFNCCVNSYPDLTFHFQFARRSLYYITNLAFPITLITVIATVVFILPEESGERITFSTTLMLAVTVFMLMVIEITPATSEAYPLISVYFTSCMLCTALMIFFLCVNSTLYNKKPGDRKMGPWTRKYILERLSFGFGVQIGKERRDSTQTYNDLDQANDENESGIVSISYKRMRDSQKLISPPTTEIGEKIEKISKHFLFKDSDKVFKQEWRVVAKTIDRFLFAIFFVLVTALTVGCFSVTTFVS